MFGLANVARALEIWRTLQTVIDEYESDANVQTYGDARKHERAQVHRGEIPDRSCVTAVWATDKWEMWAKWFQNIVKDA